MSGGAVWHVWDRAAAPAPPDGPPRLEEVPETGGWGGGNVSAPMGHITVGKLVVRLPFGLFIIVQVLESVLTCMWRCKGGKRPPHGAANVGQPQSAGGQSVTTDLPQVTPCHRRSTAHSSAGDKSPASPLRSLSPRTGQLVRLGPGFCTTPGAAGA